LQFINVVLTEMSLQTRLLSHVHWKDEDVWCTREEGALHVVVTAKVV